MLNARNLVTAACEVDSPAARILARSSTTFFRFAGRLSNNELNSSSLIPASRGLAPSVVSGKATLSVVATSGSSDLVSATAAATATVVCDPVPDAVEMNDETEAAMDEFVGGFLEASADFFHVSINSEHCVEIEGIS